MITIENQVVPFNDIQGFAFPDIPAYSNASDDFISFECSYVHGIFTGMKWQCVEFARRWLLLRRSCTFESVDKAADIWFDVHHVERITDGKHFPVKKYPNGSPDKPECGAFLLYPVTEETPFGHIAVISEVGENCIRVVEQNYRFHSWTGNYAREIPMNYHDGGYYLEDYYQVYGWVDVIDKDQLTPLDLSNVEKVLDKYRSAKPIGKIELMAFDNEYSDDEDSIDRFSMDIERHSLIHYKADSDLLMNLAGTSNELYRMLMRATDRVIHSDELLSDFGIPEVFWLPIRQAWINKSHSDLISYLQFDFNGLTLKLTDYRSDMTSMLKECAVSQQTWEEQLKNHSSFGLRFDLKCRLVRHWKQLNVHGQIHILIDSKQEQMVTAAYMQRVLDEAGIRSKICHVSDDLVWDNGLIVDQDRDIVKAVWALWKWEKVIEEYLERNKGERDSTPQWHDVLFHEDIQVIEPIWKAITNHRMMQGILNQMLRKDSMPGIEDEGYGSMPRLKWWIKEESDRTPVLNIDDGPFMDDFQKKCPENLKIRCSMVRGLFSGLSLCEDHQGKLQPIIFV